MSDKIQIHVGDSIEVVSGEAVNLEPIYSEVQIADNAPVSDLEILKKEIKRQLKGE